MSATTASMRPNPWWKEPTKDQWLAWVAAWLGWTLDAFDFTIFLLLMVPISKDFGVPLTEVAIVFTLTLWMRLGRRHRLRLDFRPHRPQEAVDDIDRMVFGLQPARRSRAEFLVAAAVPHGLGHRDGGGMARRRSPCNGNLAATFARIHGLGFARLVGPRRAAVQRRLRPAL